MGLFIFDIYPMPSMQPAKRPLGVTVIAILCIISGIVGLIAGIVLAAFSSAIPSTFEGSEMSGLPAGLLGALGVAMGGVLLALAISSFVVAYGLWNGKGWAWTLTVVLAVISIAFNAISLAGANFGGIISIIIDGIILYYVYRPHVKALRRTLAKASRLLHPSSCNKDTHSLIAHSANIL